ncbi:MAG: TonB-dependent receptor plug domain-containing protein, partial [Ignavibacteria bacterium]|nr:TonB-dependent receptor plug domain-containing protein [Ignavibacteria bacterium]
MFFFIALLCSNIIAQKKDSVIYLIPIDQIDSIKYQTDEVIVTGTRTNQKIIDIPYSVVRISPTQYKYDRKVSISDVLNAVPGVFMQSRYGNHDVRISIRGFGSRSNTGIRGVRILLDGIPESEPDGQTRIESIDFNSIGSIEIVKGNSSSLYTNAPGGVINFIN